MKAVSPVRGCGVSERGAAVLRPGVSELLDMERCYSRLKQLVPSIPADSSALSPVQVLQHVIDYICDLQGALELDTTDNTSIQVQNFLHFTGERE